MFKLYSSGQIVLSDNFQLNNVAFALFCCYYCFVSIAAKFLKLFRHLQVFIIFVIHSLVSLLGLIKMSYHGWLSLMTSSDGHFSVLLRVTQP